MEHRQLGRTGIAVSAVDAQAMEAMTLRALEASFLPAATKQQYRSELQAKL